MVKRAAWVPPNEQTAIRRMIDVKSSMLHRVGYEPKTRLLVVQFANLAVYSYADVPPNTYCVLLNAESVGVFFTGYIKDKFTTKCIKKKPSKKK